MAAEPWRCWLYRSRCEQSCLHGKDAGLACEHAVQVVRMVAGTLDDPRSVFARMKVDGCRAAGLLAPPGVLRTSLVWHGGNTRLTRERAMETVRAVAGTLDDPRLDLPA